jgi:hypothetical protein
MQVSRFRLKLLVLFSATFWAGSVAATPIVKSASGDLISPYSVSLGGWYFHVAPSIAVDGLDQNHDECGSNCEDSSSDLELTSAMDVSKILVCHKGKKTLSIGAPGLKGHLGHGDTEGECEQGTLEDPDSGPGPGVTEVCVDGLGFSGSDPLCQFPPPINPPSGEEPSGEEPSGEEPTGGESPSEPPNGPRNDVDAPATLALFGLGLLGLGYSRQRRRKR